MKTTMVLLAAGCLFLTPFAHAAAPVNNNFASSLTLVNQFLTNTVNGNNQNADKEQNEPNHAGNAGGSSVWWSWTAPVTTTVALDTIGSPIDTLLAVYTGNSLSTLTNVASDDDSGGNKTSKLTFPAVAGTVYRIAVDGWNGASGNFLLHLILAAAPPQLTALPQSQAVVPGTSVSFGVAATGAAPLSYRWRKNGAFISGATSTLYALPNAQPADAGTYTVVVTNFVGSITSSPAILTVQLFPPNDNLVNALVVSGVSNICLGNNASATKETGEPNPTGSASGKSVWWSWTAPTTARMTLSAVASRSDFGTVLAVFTGDTIPTLSLVARDDSYFADSSTRVSFAALAGTTYKFAVDSYHNTVQGDAGGDIVLTLLPPPPNDNFANRTELLGTQVSVSGYNYNATREPGEPEHGGEVGAGSVWWRWVAPSSGKFVAYAFLPLAVYSGGSVSNLTLVGLANSDEPAAVLNVIAGVEYEIAVTTSREFDANLGEDFVLTLAPSPINDAFANAITLTGQSLSVASYNFGATLEAGEPNPGLYVSKSVWWSWTAPANLAVTIDTSGTSFDEALGVYAGNSLADLALVAFSYNPVRFAALSGTTYRIAVYGPRPSNFRASSGIVRLRLDAVTPPANDAFANRILLSGTTATGTANTTNATRELGEPEHGPYSGEDRSVWWKWVAPMNGAVTLDSTGSSFQPVLAVYTGGTVSSLSLVTTSSRRLELDSSAVAFYGVAGVEYSMAAAGYPGGPVRLQLQQAPTRFNDAFSDRLAITGLTNVLVGYNVLATKENGEPNHAANPGGKSVWWTWTSPAKAHVTVDTIGSSFDTLLAVYTGNGISSLTLVATNDDRAEDRTSSLNFSAKPNTSYQIAVDGWNADSGYIQLNLQAAPDLANDAFADRIELVGSSNYVTGNLSGATVEPGEPNSEESLWWSWTAPVYGEVSIRLTGGGQFSSYIYFDVFTGNSLTNLAYVTGGSGASGTVRTFPGIAGTQYRIAINGDSGGAFAFTLTQEPPPTPFQIYSQPRDAVGYLGSSTRFSVGVAGAPPLFFQWRKDGVNLPMATNFDYFIPHLQQTDTGTYAVVVRDLVNTIASSNALLTMDDPVLPGNDAFANRFTLAGLNATVTTSNVHATKEPGEPNHAGNEGGSSVWWTWLAPANTTVTLDTIGSKIFTLLVVYTGGVVSNLTLVKSAAQAGDAIGSRLAFTAEAGTQYQIVVDGQDGHWSDITLNLRSAPPPVNDNFENRSLLVGLTSSSIGDSRGATQQTGEPNHADTAGGKSIWWTWIAPTNGTVILDTIGSSFDTLLAVYTGSSLSGLSVIAAADEGGTNHSSRLSFFAFAGSSYQIAVDGAAADSGSVALNLRQMSSFGTIDVAFKGNWPGFRNGRALDIAVLGTVAYVAIGEGGLLILDVSKPEHPRRMGGLDTPGDARNVTVADGFAYLAGGTMGISILDVRNPALVSVVGAYGGLTNVHRIAVRGSFAYVADSDVGLQILDISNKENPVPVAGIPGHAWSVVLNGSYAYVCEQTNGLRIVNISSPSNPVTSSVYRLGSVFGGVFARSVAVNNGYAYLENFFGLDIIAVTNALDPIQVYQRSLGHPQFDHIVGELSLDGDTLFIPHGVTESGGSVGRLDVKDPTNPQFVPYLGRFSLHDLAGVTPANGYAFAANGSLGITIFALSRQATDAVSVFQTAPKAFDLVVQGNHAYLANGVGGLQIVSIESPSSPALFGSSTVNGSTGAVYTVGLMGSYALAGTLRTGLVGSSGLALVDLGNLAVPRLVKAVEGLLPLKLTVLQNRVFSLSGALNPGPPIGPDDYFLHCETYSLDTYYLSVPGDFSLVHSSYPDRYDLVSGRALAVKGDYAFVAGYPGLRIIDLADVDLTYAQPTMGYVQALALAENRLVAAEVNGLEVFDVRYPTKPSLRGRLAVSIGPASGFSDVAIAGDYVLVVNPNTGLHVIDARTSDLVEVGRYPAPGCEKVVVAGNYALVAQGAQGLTILDLGPSFATAPKITFQPKDRRTLPGASARFDVGAVGTVPMTYQWQFNGVNLPGATNSILTLVNVQSNQAGAYSVVLNNSVGVTPSSGAMLTVDIPPVIALVTPANSQVFLAPATVVLEAEAYDPETNGTVTQVEFYQNSTSLGIVTTRPFRQTISLPAQGRYTFTAQATDNEGAVTPSAPVTIVVTNSSVFQFSSSSYSVSESTNQVVYNPTSYVTVAIRRNSGALAASVGYHTVDGTARAVTAAGVGQYYAVTGRVSFGVGELLKEVSVQLVNDQVYRGDRFFGMNLTEPTNGWGLAAPIEATVTILENDSTNSILSLTDVTLPKGASESRGSLRVVLEPPEAQGKWRFPWEATWRASGSTATNLPPGDYFVEFLPRNSFLAPGMDLNVVTPGANESVTNYYQGSSPPLGSLSFTLRPSTVAKAAEGLRGQWRLQEEPSIWYDSDFLLNNLPAGLYVVEFKYVEGLETPAPRIVRVVASQPTVYEATYRLARPSPGEEPTVLPSFAALTNGVRSGLPYAFNGQILSDAGWGSGFVVKRRTVLTAAHVVFDSEQLTYANNVWWFFQKHSPEYDPVPLAARGWYVFEGYAAERAEEVNIPGHQPGVSLPESQNLDVAAIYFFDEAGRGFGDAGRGGSGGYLTTDSTHNWLTSPLLKMLIGYPTEGVPEERRGRMHRAGPGAYFFESAGNQVYRTLDVKGLPGSSGGPLCVEATSGLGQRFYIPAGVYLGGSGETVVRAIDLDVVDLINRAESAANGGDDNGSGGVIRILSPLAGASEHPGLLRVSVGPPAAVRLGGRWRVSPTNHGGLTSYTNYQDQSRILSVNTTNFAIELKPLTGFRVPTNQTIEVVGGATVTLNLLYAVEPPRLVLDYPNRVGLTGSVDTMYRIESSPGLPFLSNSLSLSWTTSPLGAGTNWVSGVGSTSSNRFYRAVWLSE